MSSISAMRIHVHVYYKQSLVGQPVGFVDQYGCHLYIFHSAAQSIAPFLRVLNFVVAQFAMTDNCYGFCEVAFEESRVLSGFFKYSFGSYL